MSLKKSKKVRVLRRRGLIFFLSHCIKTCLKTKRKYGILGYIVNFMERKCEKRLKNSKYKFKILFSFYPKLTLTKSQYKTFKLANKHFNENYKNIIAINPLFFIKNLKKHITWIESKEFKNVYGNITDLSNIQLNTIEANLKENSLLKTTMIAPPPPIVSIASTKLITSITLIPLIIPLLTTTLIPLLIKIKQNLLLLSKAHIRKITL